MCQQLFHSERLQEGQELVWCSKRLGRDVAAKVRAFKLDIFHGGSDVAAGILPAVEPGFQPGGKNRP
jgi:hypothetical protein